MTFSSFCVSALALASHATALSWQQPKGVPRYGSFFGLQGQNATFDYVVVGGGTAGLTVASRLAKNRSLSVAVVEAGTFSEISNGNNSQVPQYSFSSIAGGDEYVNPWIDWELNTVPQPQLHGHSILYAQGKALGGSSTRNQMIYQRGSRGSYDRWASEVGDDSYRWDNMLQHFDRSVHVTPYNNSFRAANASVNTNEYNVAAELQQGGPLKVSWTNFAMPFSSWGLQGLSASSMPRLSGVFTNGDLHGAAYNAYTIDPTYQTRSSSETSFLQHAIESGDPLTVYPMTQAMQLLFDDEKRATGVKVQSAGRDYTLSARNEVIVSSGVMHSPQLLMVSGIGPRETLQKHNIPVIADRPGVGQNMHESCNAGGISFPVDVISTAILDRDPEYSARAVEQFNANGTGILTNEGGDVLAFEKLPESYRSHLNNATQERLAEWPADWPETEYVLSSSGKTLGGSDATQKNYVDIGILLVGALSRGNLTIRSGSMLDKPIISTNWLLDEADQEVAVQSYKRIREFWSHVNITTGPEESPGSNVTSDADLLDFIRGAVSPIHHATSTCMMGRANDTMAVVDSKARVFGVTGLRVIDSSSFRFTPPGHTQAATYAHAEKLVADVKRSLADQ